MKNDQLWRVRSLPYCRIFGFCLHSVAELVALCFETYLLDKIGVDLGENEAPQSWSARSALYEQLRGFCKNGVYSEVILTFVRLSAVPGAVSLGALMKKEEEKKKEKNFFSRENIMIPMYSHGVAHIFAPFGTVRSRQDRRIFQFCKYLRFKLAKMHRIMQSNFLSKNSKNYEIFRFQHNFKLNVTLKFTLLNLKLNLNVNLKVYVTLNLKLNLKLPKGGQTLSFRRGREA